MVTRATRILHPRVGWVCFLLAGSCWLTDRITEKPEIATPDLNVGDQQTFRCHPTSRSLTATLQSSLLVRLLLTLGRTSNTQNHFCGY